jgi:hypothetical protein
MYSINIRYREFVSGSFGVVSDGASSVAVDTDRDG